MGLVANITAGFVRVRNEINIIKQALQFNPGSTKLEYRAPANSGNLLDEFNALLLDMQAKGWMEGNTSMFDFSLLPQQAFLLGYWRLEETSGNRVNAVMPGTFDFLPTGSGAINVVPAKIGNGCAFDSTSVDYLFNPGTPFSVEDDFSISFWYKSDFSYAWGDYVVTKDSNMMIGIEQSRIQLSMTGISSSAISIQSIAANTYNYITITHNAAAKELKCYINGVQDGITHTYTGVPVENPAASLNIGTPYSQIFSAVAIDEVAIWTNCCLSAAEVNAAFNLY